MIRKLRAKFVGIIMAVVLLMLGVIFGLVIHITRENLDIAAGQVLQRVLSEPAILRDPRESVTLPYFTMTRDRRGALLIAGNINPELYTDDELQLFWETVWDQTEPEGEISGTSLRFLRAGSSCAFVDVSGQRSVLRQLVKSCISVGAVSLLAFFGISILLARWAVRPVERAWDQQRQFIADASHELKTPLTVILTNAELLEEPEYDEQDRAQFAGSILTMARQMRTLVENLLQLARADMGRSPKEVKELDYSMLITDALLPFEPLYFEQGLTLDSRVAPGIRVRGNPWNLKQVADILLDNGIKYATPGGRVELELSRHSRNQCLLRVSSPGMPLTAQQCKDIFLRFYRVDSSRSDRSSYGLGLSIAQRIVSDHHGKIWAESKDGKNHFYVMLWME